MLAPGAQPESPEVAAVVAKADAQCLELWEGFRRFVAEEQDVQRVFHKSGKVHRERRIRADYYVVRIPSARPDGLEGLLEFRDVLAVDGKPVRRDPARVMAQLTTKGATPDEESCRILGAANERNLLMGSGLHLNFTASLVSYVHTLPEAPVSYRLAPEQAADSDEVVLCFQEGALATRMREGPCLSPRPLPGAGCIHLARGDYAIRKVEVTLALSSAPLQMHMTTEYQTGPGGLRVPLRRTFQVLHPKWRNGVAGEAVATYSNFRRFSTESSIAYEPIR
jgi:hypothetical protein